MGVIPCLGGVHGLSLVGWFRISFSIVAGFSTALGSHIKLRLKQCPSIEKEKEEMMKVPYASAMDSLMYSMICTRLDIAYPVGVVSIFLSIPGKKHWNVVKWILRYL